MGGRGTDVAREASSIVLLDDDFGTLVRTLRLGRRIYDNLRKAMAYIVAVHVPIALKSNGEAGHSIPVSIRFQACSARECRPPKTIHLSVVHP